MDNTFITLMGEYLFPPSLLVDSVLIRSSGGVAVARAMPVSACTSAKRAFVALLRTLCATCRLACGVTRDSTDEEVSATFRRVARRVHPDKGGDKASAQQLNAARDAWLAARAAKGQAGRPQGAQAPQGGREGGRATGSGGRGGKDGAGKYTSRGIPTKSRCSVMKVRPCFTFAFFVFCGVVAPTLTRETPTKSHHIIRWCPPIPRRLLARDLHQATPLKEGPWKESLNQSSGLK